MQMRTTRKSFSPLLEVDYLASRARQRPVLRPAAAAQGAKTPHFAPGNRIFASPGAKQPLSAPGKQWRA